MSPKVSVIVPVYNASKHIDECVKSILDQTLQDIEIILIDDGSVDDSLEKIIKWAKLDRRVIISHHENRGTGATINKGIQIATGEFIAEVDCDDWLDPEMYEDLYNLSEGVDIVKSGFFVSMHGIEHPVPFINETRQFCPRTLHYKDRLQFFGYQPSFWSAIYRKEFIEKHNLRFDETPGATFQDFAMIFKCNALADEFVFSDKCYYHWRCDEPHTTSSTKYPFAVLDIYKSVEKFLDENPELQLPFRYMLSRLRLGTYSWNVTRIADEDKLPFATIAQADFIRDDDYQDFRLYDEQAVKTLSVWMASPEKIVEQVIKNSHKSHDV